MGTTLIFETSTCEGSHVPNVMADKKIKIKKKSQLSAREWMKKERNDTTITIYTSLNFKMLKYVLQ